MTVRSKPTCVHGNSSETRVYMWLWVKNLRTGRKVHKNKGKQTKLRQTSHQSDTTKKTYPQTRHRNREIRAIQSHWMPIKNPQRTTTRNSPVESPILLRREIPMAWGTTIDSLNPKINPSQYPREIKYLTLKDQTSYLILDSWSRSPLKFPTSAWID